MLSARAAEMRASMESLDDPIDLLAADDDEEDNAPPPPPPPAAIPPPPSPSALAAAEARVLKAVGEGGFQGADFALVQQLGRLSVGSSGSTGGGVAAIAYAARFEPGVPYQQPAPVLLKEYLQRPLALNELLAVARLQEVEEEELEVAEEEAEQQQTRQRPRRQRLPRPALPPTSSKWRAATALPRPGEPPIVPLLGYFESPPSAAAREAMGLPQDDGSGGDDEDQPSAPPTFWLVYRWEGLRPMSWFLDSAEPLPLPAMRVAERRLAGLPAAGGGGSEGGGGGNFLSRALSALRRAGPSRAEAALDQRARFLRAAAAGALAALAHCHGRGVAHGSLGAGCVMLSSAADDAAALAAAADAGAGGAGGGQRRSSSSSTSPPPLRVKLDNFGLATVGATRGGGDGVGVGASSSSTPSLSEARTGDLQALGATLAEAFFVGMSCYGGGGGKWDEDDEGDEAGSRTADRPPPPPPPRAEALRRLLFQLYGPDGKIAGDRRGDPASLRSYLLQEPSGAFAPLVAFLDGGRGEEEGEEGEGGSNSGGGWRLLAALVEGETPAALLLSLHAGWLAGSK